MKDVGWNVVIVSAWLADTSAALAVRWAGLSVFLIDRSRFPRDKIHGDGLTTPALREFASLGLDTHQIPSWRPMRRLTVGSPSGRLVQMNLPGDGSEYAATARRMELDTTPVQPAKDGGVRT